MKRRIGVFLSIIVLSYSGSASAHVVVKPSEVAPAAFQTFTIGVPNEKDIPTTQVKILIPSGVEHVTPTNKPEWQIDTEKEGELVRSITWHGGSIESGLRDDFTFSAKVPAQESSLEWKAYQTYSDGTIIAWDQSGESKGHGGNSGPFSATRVASPISEQDNSQIIAERAMYVSIASIIVSLGAIFFVTRKRT